ncbi:DMT family transporter [Jannaschia marina]|uniref:DMT family transporter n=1 Tax=Jannaschia marina TaxID=2741674 RepID=UPI0015CEA3ED|nr:DMT family transporter [Jannaschia marina]
MPLAVLTLVALCFLAANSLLTRAGVLDGTDPMAFAAIRVAAGAGVLALLAMRRGITVTGGRRWGAAVALVVYLIGFSLAYRTLDAGLGALLLFATVQLGLFALSIWRGERSGPVRLLGMGLALAGLVWLLLPGGGTRADPVDAALMVVAGLGWAAYTFAGKFEPKPLAGTAGNFLVATALMALAVPLWWGAAVTPFGAVMALASGAIASGLGYALLFRVLPRMGVATAGVAQLGVPVIAMLAGAVLLAEVPTARALLAAALVLLGIALATLRPRRGG